MGRAAPVEPEAPVAMVPAAPAPQEKTVAPPAPATPAPAAKPPAPVAEPVAPAPVATTREQRPRTREEWEISRDYKHGPWFVELTPQLWNIAVDGKIGDSTGSLPLDTNLGDGDFGAGGRIEVRNGPWGIFLDGLMFSTDGEGAVGGIVPFEFDLEWKYLELGGSWRAAEFETGGRTATVDLYGGARWNDIELDGDLGPGIASGEYDTDWFDPFVGASVSLPLADNLSGSFRGDVGGGFGDGCDFVWNVAAGVDWSVSEQVSVFVGYRWFDYDRDMHDLDMELQFQGPSVGVTIRF
jgi:opacity protein-like surface antigen